VLFRTGRLLEAEGDAIDALALATNTSCASSCPWH
jgi:hypothetical protein